MNLKIAICDDEPAQLELLSDMVRHWAGRIGMSIEIETFSSAEAFQFAWSEDKSYFLLLLDIQMEGISGIELAHLLRQENQKIAIIFITGIPDYIGEGYDLSALHYLLKPIREDKLFSCLDRALKQEYREPTILLASTTGGLTRLLQSSIMYIEVFSHTVEIWTKEEKIESHIGLNALEIQLEPGWFQRCHRSYLVGLRYVAQLGKTELTLDNGIKLPISRRLFAEVNQSFIRYYHEISEEEAK